MSMNDEQRKLVEDNMTLVHFIVNRYYPKSNRDEDVIQAGMVGLCKAAMIYDESKGVFSTIATKCILNHIRSHFKKTMRKVDTLSLEYEYDDSMTLADIVEGDKDVVSMCELVDFLGDEKQLTKDVLSMLALGYDSTEVANHLGIARSYVNMIKRMTKLKWEDMRNE